MTNSTLIAYCTCPDTETAAAIGRTIVDLRLAACVNAITGVRSYYRWEGRVEEDAEVLLIIKTSQSRMPELIEKIKEIHPYDVPELIAADIAAGLPAYLDWVRVSTAPASR